MLHFTERICGVNDGDVVQSSDDHHNDTSLQRIRELEQELENSRQLLNVKSLEIQQLISKLESYEKPSLTQLRHECDDMSYVPNEQRQPHIDQRDNYQENHEQMFYREQAEDSQQQQTADAGVNYAC